MGANADLILASVADAAGLEAQLVVFPELALNGYPIEDLALRPSFQEQSRIAMAGLATRIEEAGYGDLVCLIGYLDYLDQHQEILGSPRGGAVNAVAVVHSGAVRARYVKHHLPNYGVFDEARYFIPGTEPLVINVDGVTVCIAVCEDLWQNGGPVEWARESRADVLAVLNASPYERNKDDVRLDLCNRRAQESGAALVYVNLVGGQDELVFDGDSLVVDSAGALVARAPQFESGVMVVDVPALQRGGVGSIEFHTRECAPEPALAPGVAVHLSDEAEVYGALTVGLRDYVEKNGFSSVILGLSGGIDSALVAAIAVDALGADRVFGVSMPSRYSSEHSIADAHDIAERTGLNIRDLPIAPMFDAYLSSMDLHGLAEENLQARIRGTSLMAISNQEGHLVLATGNKSELAVGYSTIYGDAVGGFAPIKDVPKTLVWALSQWRNAVALAEGATPPIPPNSISKPPSAELRPDQMDSDSLPDYALLDELIESYVDRDLSPRDLVAAGFEAAIVERVITLIDRAEYKRRQYPPGTKISLKAFGRDRRLPITNGWREPIQPI
jgi:NAD+ synthase (glutamine-hydrolysing)